MLLDEVAFTRMFDEVHAECGNRIRPLQMLSMFKKVGFNRIKFTTNIYADDKYLNDFMDRLKDRPWNLYSKLSISTLKSVSGLFVFHK